MSETLTETWKSVWSPPCARCGHAAAENMRVMEVWPERLCLACRQAMELWRDGRAEVRHYLRCRYWLEAMVIAGGDDRSRLDDAMLCVELARVELIKAIREWVAERTTKNTQEGDHQ